MRLGLTYPFNLNGGYNFSEIEYIQTGIRAYLDIRYFELFHKPFGVDLEDVLFDPLDVVFLDKVELVVAEALNGFEPIILRSLQFSEVPDNPNALAIDISYSVRLTGQEDFYTYILSNNS